MNSTGGCRLLGVALVVDDISKGCNLAFRYPFPPRKNASSFHTLPAPLLAKLFRPKNALCNASFELVVDDLRFVSHPVLVSRRSPTAAPVDNVGNDSPVGVNANGALRASSFTVTEHASTNGSSTVPLTSGNETTMFNIIFALEDCPLQESRAAEALAGLYNGTHLWPLQQADEEELFARRRMSAQSFHTVAAQLANGLLHEELRVGFVSKEVRELLQVRDEVAQSERTSGNKYAGVSGIGSTGSSLSASVAAGNTNGNGTTSNAGGGGGGTGSNGVSLGHQYDHRKDGESGSTSVEVDAQTLIDVSLGKSVLANDLKRVFHGLAEAGAAHVVLNGWVKLSLTLTDAVTVRMASLRPYHTLLLLSDKSAILNKLPADHARQLRDLVEAVNPLKSFQDIALGTSVPIHQVFRLSAHLVYWGYGRIVDAITLYNIYQVNPNADLHVKSPLALDFRRKFAPYELGEVLSTFSGTRRIGEHMKTLSTTKKTEYIHMLIWLLQQRFVIQLHRYIYFMIPSDGDYAADVGTGSVSSVEGSSLAHVTPSFHRLRMNGSLANATASGSVPIARTPPGSPASLALLSPPMVPSCERSAAEGQGDSRVPMPQATNVASQLLFTDQERAYLAKIAKPNPVFALFKRLCVYFHGEHHIEEIMWRENLSRGELRTVMSTYQDIIVCCLHE
uniref:GATOR1 complex protein NPRL3 C-terminal HTH domain-containing protein n=1 Tax=Peronospora matthiolae TaxID=2874970 RepID=A0AAV1UTM6_9STRA